MKIEKEPKQPIVFKEGSVYRFSHQNTNTEIYNLYCVGGMFYSLDNGMKFSNIIIKDLSDVVSGWDVELVDGKFLIA